MSDTRISFDDVKFINEYKCYLPAVKNFIAVEPSSIRKMNDLEILLSATNDFSMAAALRDAGTELLTEIDFKHGQNPTFSAEKFDGMMIAIKKAYQNQQNMSSEQMCEIYQRLKRTILAMDARNTELKNNATQLLELMKIIATTAARKTSFTAGATKKKLELVGEEIDDMIKERWASNVKSKVDVSKLSHTFAEGRKL